MLSYFERVCDSHNHNTCNININYKINYSRINIYVACIMIVTIINYKINYSRISIIGLKVWNQVQSNL